MSSPRNRTSWAIPIVVVAVAVVVAVVLTVSGGGSSDEPPAPGSPEELALGEEVYDQSCATCHGPEAGGGLAGPPLVHEVYGDLTDAQIRTAIAQGKPPTNWPQFEGGMSPVPNLSATDVAAVIAYVRDAQREAWGGDAP